MNQANHRIRTLALPACCVALFLVLGAVNLAHHEMWRDELQHWTIARLSNSPMELYHNTRYEGTPLLWHSCLMVITRLTTSPLAMQALSLAVAAGAVAIFAFTSPFNALQKVLFSVSYYPLYEYSTISRSYGMGMAALLLFCAGYPWTGGRRWVGVAGLALLAHTSVYGVIVATAGGVAMLAHHLGRPATVEPRDGDDRGERRSTIIALTMVAAAILFAVVVLKPAHDYGIHRSWFKGFNLRNVHRGFFVGSTPWRAIVPVPKLRSEFWNTNVLDTPGNDLSVPGLAGNIAQMALSVGLLAGTWIVIRRHRAAAWLWGVASAGLLMFFFLKKVGYVRHHGYLYLVALAAVWLVMAQWKREGDPQPRLRRTVCVAVTTVLLLHVAAAAWASVVERRLPFSASKQAAAWIQAQGHDDDLLAGWLPAYGLTVAMRLDKPFYFANKRDFYRFGIWDQRRFDVEPADMPRIAAQLQAEHSRAVLLVMSEPLNGDDPTGRITAVAQFTDTIEPTERYYLYHLPLPPAAR